MYPLRLEERALLGDDYDFSNTSIDIGEALDDIRAIHANDSMDTMMTAMKVPSREDEVEYQKHISGLFIFEDVNDDILETDMMNGEWGEFNLGGSPDNSVYEDYLIAHIDDISI